MTIFEISYELRGYASPSRYARLAEAIKAMTGDWAHQPESLWYVYGPDSWAIGQIRNHLMDYIDAGDRLTVSVPLKIEAYGLDPQVDAWLRARLKPMPLQAILSTLPATPPIGTPAYVSLFGGIGDLSAIGSVLR